MSAEFACPVKGSSWSCKAETPCSCAQITVSLGAFDTDASRSRLGSSSGAAQCETATALTGCSSSAGGIDSLLPLPRAPPCVVEAGYARLPVFSTFSAGLFVHHSCKPLQPLLLNYSICGISSRCFGAGYVRRFIPLWTCSTVMTTGPSPTTE